MARKDDAPFERVAAEALALTPAGPDRLERARAEARRLMLDGLEGEERALWAKGTWAVNPGADPLVTKANGTAMVWVVFASAWAAGATVSFVPQAALLLVVLGSALGAAAGLTLYTFRPLYWAAALSLFGLAWAFSPAGWPLPAVLILLALSWGLAWRFSRPVTFFDEAEARRRLVFSLKSELAMVKAAAFTPAGEAGVGALDDLWPALVDLGRSQGPARAFAADALVDLAARLGLRLDEGPQQFVWNETSAELYDLFGLASAGDVMQEERPPYRDPSGRLVKGLARRKKS